MNLLPIMAQLYAESSFFSMGFTSWNIKMFAVAAIILHSIAGTDFVDAAVDTENTRRAEVKGFFDCHQDEGSPSIESLAKRAFRRMALQHHPDKTGGSGSVTAELAALRDSWVSEPLRFQVFRAMFDPPELSPVQTSGRPVEAEASDSKASQLRGAHAGITWQDGWPYFELEVDIDHGHRLDAGGSWTFAMGLKGVSTIHYRGDESEGGYDVCCDFIQDSRCRRRPLAVSSAMTSRSEQNSSASEECADSSCRISENSSDANSLYVYQDCPLPSRFPSFVRRPLHLNSTGSWGAALQVKDARGRELACVAFSFQIFVENVMSATGVQASSLGGEAHAESEVRSEGKSSGHGSSRGSDNRFEHLKTQAFCEDGVDLLEGPLDNYGGLSPFGGAARASAESSLFYGSKCREKCRKRKACKFYTVYSSGWCQLSSRCSQLGPAGDPLTITFRKVLDQR
eukprot:TRINITY_DN64890_c0_g1_i1.p1 TRINITY_DN64890_c0_g1~~TRINITY_DN64890_c0_g1_i1.p1  ORF type:complete len:455 (+),score=47.37 TRINITY_DN64890_c0_g1_i1:22-1386(+)